MNCENDNTSAHSTCSTQRLSVKDIRQAKWYEQMSTLLVVIAFFVFSLVDPFALRTATEKHYNNLLSAIASPFYADKLSEEITVVLIDESYFRTYKESLANYTNLAYILKRLDKHSPTAVYFNFLQHYEHSGSVSRWIRRLKKASIPTYMASLPTRDSAELLADETSLRHQLSKVSEFAAVNWQGAHHIYPLWVPWHTSSVNANWVNKPAKRMPTPAMALYAHWCLDNRAVCETSKQHEKGFFDSSDFIQPLYVQWGEQQSNSQTALMYQASEHCVDSDTSKLQRAFERAIFYLQFGLGDKTQTHAFQLHCPPYLSVSATRLLDRSLPEELWKTLFNQRVVLVGYDNKIAGVNSPIHGTVSSVYLHAAALDNLIRRGNHYWQVPKSTGLFRLNTFDWLQLLVQCVVLYIATLQDRKLAKEGAIPNWKTVGRRVSWSMFWLMVAILPALLISLFWHSGFFNWFVLPLIFCIFFIKTLRHILLLLAIAMLQKACEIALAAKQNVQKRGYL